MKESIRMSQHIQPKEVLSPIIGDLYMLSHCSPAGRNWEMQSESISASEMSSPGELKAWLCLPQTHLCPVPHSEQCIDLHNWRQSETTGSGEQTELKTRNIWISLKEKSGQSTNQVPHWLIPIARKMSVEFVFFPSSHREHWARVVMEVLPGNISLESDFLLLPHPGCILLPHRGFYFRLLKFSTAQELPHGAMWLILLPLALIDVISWIWWWL